MERTDHADFVAAVARPEVTAGQRIAGRILRIFGYLAQLLGCVYWCLAVAGGAMVAGSGEHLAFPSVGYGVVLVLLFYVSGRAAGQFGRLLEGREGALGGRLFLKGLVQDLVFEVVGLLVVPLVLSGVVLLVTGELLGLSFLLGAAVVGFGLSRLLHLFIRRM